jgi:hypothetical protein
VLTSSIDTANNGWAHTVAEVTGLDTSGAVAEGDEVYLSGTAGEFVHTVPAAPDLSQIVGRVSEKAVSGRVFFDLRYKANVANVKITRAGGVFNPIRTRSFM